MGRLLIAGTLLFGAVFQDLPRAKADLSSSDRLHWTMLADLPASHGVGGPFAGVHRGALIVAGGANFPEAPPWENGTKVWYDDVYVLETPDAQWLTAGKLPQPRAYGASISTDRGVVLIGGDRDGTPTAKVSRLRWDPQKKTLQIDSVPSLPQPAANLAAGRIGTKLYVVAAGRSDGSNSLDQKYFWSLNLTAENAQAEWEQLPPCPGPARHQPVAAVQALGSGEEQFFLFSGIHLRWLDDGSVDNATSEYLADGFRFDPAENRWTRIHDLPPPADVASENLPDAILKTGQPVAAATAVPSGQSHILVFSGSHGRESGTPLAERHPFPRDVLAYHTITDTWTHIGKMPIGVVTTTAVTWNDSVVIPSGEIRPGVRTPAVQAMQVVGDSVSFGWLNYSVLIAYLFGMLAVGVFFSFRMRSTDDFFRGGQRVPFWAAGLSIFATMLSSITFMALPAKAYATNWLYYPAQLTIIPIAFIVVWIVLPFFRRIDATSAYEYLELRFNRPVRLLGSAQFVMFQVGRMAVVMYLPALALATVTPISVGQCVILMGILSVVYCTMGGVEAVIWTDAIQTIVLMVGLLLAILIAMLGIEGNVWETWMAAAKNGKMTLADLDFSLSSYASTALWVVIFGQFFQSLYSYTSDQAVVQRYLTTHDEHGARKAMWTTAYMSVFGSLLFFVLGTALYIYYQRHAAELLPTMKTDAIFPLFIAKQLPVGVAGLVVAGIFAAAQSTISTSMNSTATALVTDFCRPFNVCRSDVGYLRLAQLFTALLGIVGTAMAYWLTVANVVSMVDQFMTVLGLFGGALCGLFMLGMLTRRANAFGGLIGILVGAGVVWTVKAHTATNQFLYAAVGTLTTFVVGYLVSYLAPRSGQEYRGLTIHG